MADMGTRWRRCVVAALVQQEVDQQLAVAAHLHAVVRLPARSLASGPVAPPNADLATARSYSASMRILVIHPPCGRAAAAEGTGIGREAATEGPEMGRG